MTSLADGFGRTLDYLRLSVDDSCDFHCLYCLPGREARSRREPPLSIAEIRRLVTAFAGLGAWKVRLSGGEPTLRRDLLDIAAAIREIPGIGQVCLSTNGHRLAELAEGLRRAGVTSVNVSLDSLDAGRFAAITGARRLDAVLLGAARGSAIGLDIKINTLLLKDLNDAEIRRFLDLPMKNPWSVRFIELMPTARNEAFFRRCHVPIAGLLRMLAGAGWKETPRQPGQGPARVFSRPGCRGTVGVISPGTDGFCQYCNRLRVTSRGLLKLCLFSEQDHSLRPFLQDDGQLAALARRIRELAEKKPHSHRLAEGHVGGARHFAAMGG
ncbi:MAG TPA: GTP 3',8-cyclase MoaA [Elusimicrobia bacterium]|nr:GTP 3',8-cyclase MoaA [Elusimicrobiota bacterium]HBT60717.1 GTP 3',8-cyclase MoaA [Elusimicrobiota bacterium]